MKRIFSLVAVLVLAGWTLGDEGAIKKEQALLQGDWTVVTVEKDGKADPKYKGAVRTHAGETYSFKLSEGPPITGTFKVDPTKTPKQFDSVPSGGTFKGKNLPGIYKLEGDTLTVCFDGAGKERPGEFASKGTAVLAVYKKK